MTYGSQSYEVLAYASLFAMTPAEIAAQAGIPKQNVYVAVSRMRKDGLIRHNGSPHVISTPKGSALYQRMYTAHAKP